MVEGSSLDEAAVARPAAAEAVERVMVVLDSNHTHEHVLAELRAYARSSPWASSSSSPTRSWRTFRRRSTAASVGAGRQSRDRARAWLGETEGFEPDPFVNAKLLLTASPGGYLRRVR